jgi:hypothetical protein
MKKERRNISTKILHNPRANYKNRFMEIMGLIVRFVLLVSLAISATVLGTKSPQTSLPTSLPSPQIGDKVTGSGLNCWDINANSKCDLSEDINGDGICDYKDCKGPKGFEIKHRKN